MKVMGYWYRKAGRAALLAALALVLAALLGQPGGYLALAQEPEEGATPEVEVTPEPQTEPDDIGPVEPPVEDEPGEVEVTPEPQIDPDDTGPVEPPAEDELGEPVVDEAYVSGADVVDEEGGVINIFDLSFVASQLGSTNPAADVNLDGQVNIFDLAMLAANFNQPGPASAAAEPEPVPLVEEGVTEFGALDLAVEAPEAGADVASAAAWRPLRIGLGVNYVRAYDYMDGQTNTPPDLYALVTVSGVAARTWTWWDSAEIWPNWRLGWWRYAGFPWAPSTAPDANNYSLPIVLEMRDDDGQICYGGYGCRHRYEWTDISSQQGRRTKQLTFYPNTCRVQDEAGTQTTGYWLNSAHTHCRIHLQAWGTEVPRAYTSYFIDAVWD